MKFKSNDWIGEWQHADDGKPYIGWRINLRGCKIVVHY